MPGLARDKADPVPILKKTLLEQLKQSVSGDEETLRTLSPSPSQLRPSRNVHRLLGHIKRIVPLSCGRQRSRVSDRQRSPVSDRGHQAARGARLRIAPCQNRPAPWRGCSDRAGRALVAQRSRAIPALAVWFASAGRWSIQKATVPYRRGHTSPET